MANRFWRGGTGYWDSTNTTPWSATSGGAGGASVPTRIDDVFFDANSAPGAGITEFTVTVAANRPCQNLRIQNLTQTLTITTEGDLYISGELLHPTANFAGYNASGYFIFNSNSAIQRTITQNGIGFPTNCYFDGPGGSFRLGSAFYAPNIIIKSGTFNSNNFNVDTNYYFGGGLYFETANTKTFTMGSSTFTAGRFAVFGTGAAAATTVNSGTSLVHFPDYDIFFYGGGKVWYDILSTQGSYGGDIQIVDANNSFNNVQITPHAFHQFYRGGLAIYLPNSNTSNTIIRNTLIANSAAGGFYPVAPTEYPWAVSYVVTGQIDPWWGGIQGTPGKPTTLTVNTMQVQDLGFESIRLRGNASALANFYPRTADFGNNSGINFRRRNIFYKAANTGGSRYLGSNTYSFVSGGPITANAIGPFAGVDTIIIDNNSGLIDSANSIIINGLYQPYGTISTNTRTEETYIEFTGACYMSHNLFFGNTTVIQNQAPGGGGGGALIFQGINQSNISFPADNVALPYIDVSKSAYTPSLTSASTTRASVNVSVTRGNTINVVKGIEMKQGTLNIPGFDVVTTMNLGGLIYSPQDYCEISGITNKKLNFVAYKDVNNWIFKDIGDQFAPGAVLVYTGGGPNTTIDIIDTNGDLSIGRSICVGNTYNYNIIGGNNSTIYWNYTAPGIARDFITKNYNGTFNNMYVVYGNLIMNNSVSAKFISSDGFPLIFDGYTGDSRATKSISVSNSFVDVPVTFSGVGNTYQLTSGMNVGSSRATTFQNGAIVDLNAQTLKSGSFTLTSGTIKFNSGTLEVLGTSFTGSSSVLFSDRESGFIKMSSASDKTFAGQGLVYPTLDVSGTGNLTITGNNRFHNITNSEKNTRILLPANGLTTVNNFTYSGNSTVSSNITSSTGGTSTTIYGEPGTNDIVTVTQIDWSNYFDGVGDYLSIAANSAFTLGTNDHCIEFWIYPDGPQPPYATPWYYAQSATQQATNNYYLNWADNTGAALLLGGGGSWVININLSAYLTLNAWTHIVITRSGSTFRVFVNGVLAGTGTYAGSITAQGSPMLIGSDSGNNSKSYISNFRFINGSIPTQYQTSNTTVGTSIFTPSTSALTAIANTTLLTCVDNRFVDRSNNRFTITKNGNVEARTFGPRFVTQTTIPRSNLFGGGQSYLTIPSNTSLSCDGNIDFCMEAWVYRNVSGVDQTILNKSGVYGISYPNYAMGIGAGDNMTLYLGNSGGPGSGIGLFYNASSTNLLQSGKWNHLVATKKYVGGGAVNEYRMFVNGKLEYYFTQANPSDPGNYAFNIGIEPSNPAGGFNGYINGLRIVKNSIPTEYQTSSTTINAQIFTPPANTLTAIANTSLLTCDSVSLIDRSANNLTITKTGDVSIVRFLPFTIQQLPFKSVTQYLSIKDVIAI